MVNKFKFGLVGILTILVLSVVSVSAIGAGGVPEFIEVSPGETVDRTLSLQNLPAGDGDLTFKIIVNKGSEYVSVIDDQVNVLDGEIGESKIKISVPESANVGDVYDVVIDFKTSPIDSTGPGNGGTAVQFSLGTSASFDIRVVEATETPAEISTTWIILGILGIIVLIIIIKFILKSGKETPSKK
jgi:hypothetical protein